MGIKINRTVSGQKVLIFLRHACSGKALLLSIKTYCICYACMYYVFLRVLFSLPYKIPCGRQTLGFSGSLTRFARRFVLLILFLGVFTNLVSKYYLINFSSPITYVLPILVINCCILLFISSLVAVVSHPHVSKHFIGYSVVP